MMRIELTEMELEDVLVALRGRKQLMKQELRKAKFKSLKEILNNELERYRALISKFDNVRKGKEHECTESDEA